ncbi:hypothetical protein BGY98DRAFT_1097195 [Russula aff. rugulosa BPL654]|nr:hypothetical protein BGY98DRAFT_1097195 [Russula aff. rugulosa BPL654]
MTLATAVLVSMLMEAGGPSSLKSQPSASPRVVTSDDEIDESNHGLDEVNLLWGLSSSPTYSPDLRKVSQGGLMAKSSLAEIARLLVNFGADVNVTDDEGWAPLHAAAQSGYRDIAELLLGSSASLDALNKK